MEKEIVGGIGETKTVDTRKERSNITTNNTNLLFNFISFNLR